MRQINLSPPDRPQASGGEIPTANCLRWRSPYDEEERELAVAVFLTQEAYVRVSAHAGSDLYNEVGGWLVGKWRADKESGREFIVVEANLPANHIRHGSAHLTFTQDTQVALHDELQLRYPEKEIVGWYHTHPRMGVFFSDYDHFLHRNFFPERYQVALVIEPHSLAGGFFIRQADGGFDPSRYYGFYELSEETGRSVMHWKNLHLDSEGESQEEDDKT